jgi:transcriptional regulator with XRE-family HTH domain
MHPTYLSGIERGKRNPTWGKLCALADALGVPTATIAHEIERATCPTCGRQPDVLHYEGPVYVRPLGRGIVLVNEPSEPLLDDWMEAWLAERDPHRPVSGGEFRARLRIVVEYVCENAQV